MERNVTLETAITPVEEVGQHPPASSVPPISALQASPAHNILSLTVLLPPNDNSPMMESGRNLGLHSTACSVDNSAGAAAIFDHQMNDLDELPPPKADLSAPPPYEIATKLPTYEEVQREKTLHGEPTPGVGVSNPGPGRLPPPLAFLAIDAENPDADAETGLLGTDFMFFTAFLVAFLFNWIGFLLLMCFCHTIAARYGALSGFGLSLAKWTLIVKHSTDLASRENSWLWWLIMAFGLLICVRAIIQYLNIKRGWRLLSGSAQERLLFFY